MDFLEDEAFLANASAVVDEAATKFAEEKGVEDGEDWTEEQTSEFRALLLSAFRALLEE